MVTSCKGICHKYKVTKLHSEMGGRYDNGHKRCNECEIFIKWDGKRCPCCSLLLRLRPRSGITRSQFMESKDVKRI